MTPGRLLAGGPLLKPPPAAQRHQRPHRLDDAEWPGALQEAVERGERARAGEGQHEPVAARLQGVADEHRRDGGETEQREGVQAQAWPWSRSMPVTRR